MKRAVLYLRSLQDLVAFLPELHALGIDLLLQQQGLDTTAPARPCFRCSASSPSLTQHDPGTSPCRG